MSIDGRRITVAVVDDHAVLRAGLCSWLAGAAPDLDVVVTAASWPELVDDDAFPTDVVLLDLDLRDGVPASAKIATARAAGSAVVVVSTFTEPGRVRDSISAGALGYVPKSDDPSEIVAAIRCAVAGEAYLTPSVAGSLAAQQLPSLSPREREALVLYAGGLPLKLVARRMGVQYDTAKGYLDSVRRKYARAGRDARTKLDLVRRVDEDGVN